VITAIVIPAELDQPLRREELEATDLGAFQRLVGGRIEPVELYLPNGTLYLNEEGKNEEMPVNQRATALASVHNRLFRGNDYVAGDAVVVGPLNGRGHDTTVPARYALLWFEAQRFRVRRKEAGKRHWNVSRRTFDDVMVAYVYAVRLARRDPTIEEVRVVPVN